MAAERNEDRKVVAIDLDIKSCQCAGFFLQTFQMFKNFRTFKISHFASN